MRLVHRVSSSNHTHTCSETLRLPRYHYFSLIAVTLRLLSDA